jgi:hypothetical protein
MEQRDRIAYALVQDVASTWQQYKRLAAGLYDPPPDGLIIHLAGPTDEGVRMIAVWESEQDWLRFHTESVQPAIAALGGPARPEPTIRHLHGVQLVVGGQARISDLAPQGIPIAQPRISSS